ncbi:MAG TPA: alkaline phosphatase family protein, partial [Pedobacter sp.]
ITSGPDFKKNFESDLPTSNVDITPTILYLNHLPVPPQMDGRVVYELLNEKTPPTAPSKVKAETVITEVKAPWGNYKVILHRSVLGKYIYTDYAETKRELK